MRQLRYHIGATGRAAHNCRVPSEGYGRSGPTFGMGMKGIVRIVQKDQTLQE